MITTEIKGNECYVFLNGHLLHKSYIDGSQSGVTFDIRAYRKGDSLKSITRESVVSEIENMLQVVKQSNKEAEVMYEALLIMGENRTIGPSEAFESAMKEIIK